MAGYENYDEPNDSNEPDPDVELYYHDSEAWPNPKDYPKEQDEDGPELVQMKTTPGRALELIDERKIFDRHKAAVERSHDNPSTKQQTAAGLDSVGLSYDHLTDLSEDMDFMFMNNAEIIKLKDQISETVIKNGPEKSIQLADDMLLEGRLSESAYRIITRLIRMNALNPKNQHQPMSRKK